MIATNRDRRPVVGITSYIETAKWGVWDQPAVVLPYSYVRGVEAAGARAVVIPPSPSGVDGPAAIAAAPAHGLGSALPKPLPDLGRPPNWDTRA